MRSKRILLGLVVLLGVGAGVLAACGDAAEEPAEEPLSGEGETLLQERCTVCHGLDRTTSAQKTRGEWEETVNRMVDRGAELNEQEKTVLIGYLAETYAP